MMDFMESSGIVTFETPIGPCGIAWRGSVIVGVAIGDTDERVARHRLSEISPGSESDDPPAFVGETVEKSGRFSTAKSLIFRRHRLRWTVCPN